MAHNFNIRFARSSTLAAYFESSANRFGWRGDGHLTIDPLGVDVGVKRSLASLFVRRRSQRISAEQIREVYREGDALRIEFSTPAQPREVLPLWARDRDAAAQIVELLPTTHTVEIEHSPDPDRSAPTTRRRWIVFVAALIPAAIVLPMIVLRRPAPPVPSQQPASVELPPPGGAEPYTVPTLESGSAAASPATPRASAERPPPTQAPSPDANVSRVPAPAAALPVSETPRQTTAPAAAAATATAPAPSAEFDPDNFVPSVPEITFSAEEQVVPLRQNTLAYDRAREILARFESAAAELSRKFRALRERADANSTSPASIAKGLDELDSQWEQLRGSLNQPGKIDPALTGFIATLAAVTNYQSQFLSAYAAAIRAKDPDAVQKAFGYLQRAEDMLTRARLYVR